MTASVARLAANRLKILVGSLGSARRIKTIGSDIKNFAVDWGDECVQRIVAEMQVQEETLTSRFKRDRTGV